MRTSTATRLALVLISGSLLSACGMVSTPGTMNLRPAGTGVHTSVDNLLIQDTIVVAASDGTLSLSATVISTATDSDNLNAVLFNGEPAALTPAEQIIPAGGVVRFGFNATSFADLAQSTLKAGDAVKVTYVFASGAEASVHALVVSNSNPMYSNVLPAKSV